MKALAVLGDALKAGANSDPVANLNHRAVAVADRGVALLERYFRASVRGLENMPAGRALLVGNHNAGITFLEPFILGRSWYNQTHGEDPIYFLAHDAIVAMPVLGNLLRGLGVLRASQESALAAFAAGHKVMVFPGGNFEAFRPFSQRFSVDFGGKTGFVRLALRAGVNIVPVLSVGGHETLFVLWRGEKLAKLTRIDKYLRSESFPLFLGLPWGLALGPVFHLPLPAKVVVEVGQPIDLGKYHPSDADDPELVATLARKVQFRLQEMMDRHAGERRWPILG